MTDKYNIKDTKNYCEHTETTDLSHHSLPTDQNCKDKICALLITA